MEIRYYIDPDLNEPHIHKHAVSQEEIVAFFMESQYFEIERADGSFEAVAILPSGRPLTVAYRRAAKTEIFVITAYDIEHKETIHYLEDQL